MKESRVVSDVYKIDSDVRYYAFPHLGRLHFPAELWNSVLSIYSPISIPHICNATNSVTTPSTAILNSLIPLITAVEQMFAHISSSELLKHLSNRMNDCADVQYYRCKTSWNVDVFRPWSSAYRSRYPERSTWRDVGVSNVQPFRLAFQVSSLIVSTSDYGYIMTPSRQLGMQRSYISIK